MEEVDAVIVGSGYGGSITAARLAEAGMSVVVLERGARRGPDELEQSNTLAYMLDVIDTVTFIFERLAFRTGNLVGGASITMDGAHFRAPSASFDATDSKGRRFWPDSYSRQELDPYYARNDLGPAALCSEHDEVGERPSGEALPHLGGAPNTPQGRTVAAFVDTIVPGRHRDETAASGGIDVGVPGVFFDTTLPIHQFTGLLSSNADFWATQVVPGKLFAELSVTDRDRAVDMALENLPEMQYAVQMVQLAYYSSPGAACLLGYPGANPGYVNDPDMSLGKPVSTEVTSDGNLP